ncbi:MAG TPA: response regulator [Burkholderiales bacterium]|nr:response regulator [Burkholderiales bacterium]
MAKILVIDDCSIMRELFSLQLGAVGHIVHKAENGVAARNAVMRDRPDLIVSNVDMPLLDGFQLMAALREDSAASAIPIIIVSSNTEYARRAKSLGAAAFLGKPVAADNLRSAVAANLPAL